MTIIPVIERWTLGKNNAVNYINSYLQKQQFATSEILDIKAIGLFSVGGEIEEKGLKQLIKKIRTSSGILIVTSEFNGEYPKTLKILIDFFYERWNHKPVAISTVCDDEENCSQIIRSLQFSLWKINTYSVPVSFHVPGIAGASRSTDSVTPEFSSRQAVGTAEELEFQQVFNTYCNKYIQLCTRIEYAV